MLHRYRLTDSRNGQATCYNNSSRSLWSYLKLLALLPIIKSYILRNECSDKGDFNAWKQRGTQVGELCCVYAGSLPAQHQILFMTSITKTLKS